MLSYIITFLWIIFCVGAPIFAFLFVSTSEAWLKKGCHVQEAIQFSGKNTGPEIVIPIMPLACWCFWVKQDCSLSHFAH